jgi:hypothetical protein
MTAEIEELHRNPPDQDRVCLEIGRTILAVQPTESALNAITLIVIPDRPFTVEGLAGFDPNKKSKTLGQLKSHLVDRLKVNLDASFLSALERFIDDRNLLVHRADSILGWNLKTPDGRIAAFLFLKNLQITNVLVFNILLGLVFHYDRKRMYGVIAKVAKDYGLFPDTESQEQLAKQLFGISSPS